MAQGCFIVRVMDDSRIVIQPIEGRGPVPDEQNKLVQLVTEVETTLKVLFRNKPDQLRFYLERLASNARAGLTPEEAYTDLATDAIEGLKREITLKEGRYIKTKYLVELGWISLVSAGVAGLLFLMLHARPDMVGVFHGLKNYFVVWAGAMVGLWVSYAARRTDVNFDELSIMDKRTTEATIRVLFVGLVATAFALFLSTGLMEFSIGDIRFHAFKASGETAGLLGVIAGFSEQTLPTKLMEVGRKGVESV